MKRLAPWLYLAALVAAGVGLLAIRRGSEPPPAPPMRQRVEPPATRRIAPKTHKGKPMPTIGCSPSSWSLGPDPPFDVSGTVAIPSGFVATSGHWQADITLGFGFGIKTRMTVAGSAVLFPDLDGPGTYTAQQAVCSAAQITAINAAAGSDLAWTLDVSDGYADAGSNLVLVLTGTGPSGGPVDCIVTASPVIFGLQVLAGTPSTEYHATQASPVQFGPEIIDGLAIVEHGDGTRDGVVRQTSPVILQ